MKSRPKSIQIVKLYSTPEALREVANKMDKFIAVASIGDNKTIDIWAGENLEIHFIWDQP